MCRVTDALRTRGRKADRIGKLRATARYKIPHEKVRAGIVLSHRFTNNYKCNVKSLGFGSTIIHQSHLRSKQQHKMTTTSSGACLCGAVAYIYTGEPVMRVKISHHPITSANLTNPPSAGRLLLQPLS